MGYLEAMFMGLVQGLAEFLPISSSGHLAIFSRVFGLGGSEGTFLAVLLHLGTFLSVCIVFWKDVSAMIVDVVMFIPNLITKKRSYKTDSARMIVLIIISLLPLFVILPFKSAVEAAFANITLVGAALLVTAALLILADRFKKGRKDVSKATWLDALVVGIFQTIAVTPGLSRSGATISAGIFRGFDRTFAVRFSFLMSLPTIVAAVLLEGKDVIESGGIDAGLIGPYVAGFAVAAVTGFFAIRLMKYIADKGKFGGFAIYCAAMGVFSIIYGLV